MSYECGEVPEGSAWVKFNIRFYIIALIFIAIEILASFFIPNEHIHFKPLKSKVHSDCNEQDEENN